MLTNLIRKYIGGLRVLFACVIVFCYLNSPRDAVSFGTLCVTIGAWMKFETDKRTDA